MIESLGHGKRLRLCVELGLKINSCNPFLISLCKVTHHYSGTESCSLSSKLGQYWTELGKQICLCYLSFSHYFIRLLVFIIVTHVDIGCLINLLHTSSILLV